MGRSSDEPERPPLVLAHSPFSGPCWGSLPAALRERSYEVVVLDILDDEHPPYAATYIARAAQQMAAADVRRPVVLVGHSGAGPLLPQLGATQRAARRPARAYVLLDASLPRAGASRLDLLSAVDADLASAVRADLAAGRLAPAMDHTDLLADGLDDATAGAVIAASRPRGLAFFEEVIPHPDDWPDAPVGYLQTSPARAPTANVARLRGFEVRAAEGGHFAALSRPAELAGALDQLVTAL